VEIWLFNEAPLKPEKYHRWDAVLQIHGEQVYSSPSNWVNMDYWNWLQQARGKPVYMQHVDPRVPDSVEYPLEGILSMIPYKYLRSSPAMALALAIYLGYDHIMLFGSELTSNTEYSYQATNYAFWIGFAHGKGINLELRCWKDEFHQEVYGYEGELQLPKDFFASRASDAERVYHSKRKAMDRIKERLDQAFNDNDFDRVGDLSLQWDEVSIATGEAWTVWQEAMRYGERGDMISRQEFERTSAQAQIDGEKLRSLKDHSGGKAEYVWNAWKQSGVLAAKDQLRLFLKEKQKHAFNTGCQLGIFRENLNYIHEYDAKLQAAGGIRALGRQNNGNG
jgi:hypothetical protein